MQKIWIILKSEFWRRVRTKGYILATLLAPLGFLLVMVAPGLLGAWIASGGGAETRTVAVVDETGGRLMQRLQQQADTSTFRLRAAPPEAAPDSLRRAVRSGDYDGYLVLPATLLGGEGRARYYAAEATGIGGQDRLSDLIDEAVRSERLDQQGTPAAVRDIMEARVPFEALRLTDEGEAGGTELLGFIGLLLGMAIYAMVFIYGQFVMQGVIEEKASRVVEIVVSSVQPFHLLMGKVLGIGAVALTQVVLWGALVAGGLAFAAPLMALFVQPADLDLPADASSEAVMEAAAGFAVPAIPPSLLVWFVLFFVGGYLLYSSLFAAVGSAVEQQQDAQSLVFPITVPLIIPVFGALFAIESPGAALSVGLSLVPFFSPIIMPVRIAAGAAPLWQVLLAFVLLCATFVGMIWLSARIYRVGILMYGKKPSFGELWRWARQ